jgi:hypothetical protein
MTTTELPEGTSGGGVGTYDTGTSERVPARAGLLYFKYEDPSVDVTTEQRTAEHETIDDNIVIQALGRRADQITVNAIVASFETPLVDQLTRSGVITLRTERWSGDVIVTSTDTSFRRELDKNDAWLYDATIECIEAN